MAAVVSLHPRQRRVCLWLQQPRHEVEQRPRITQTGHLHQHILHILPFEFVAHAEQAEVSDPRLKRPYRLGKLLSQAHTTIGAMKYSAFISYRHSSHSRKHAERLEAAIKRYAKPAWARPRAIFRDEHVLLPGENLPAGIRAGLEESEFLIYLASKEAAKSEWIQDELRIWCSELGRADKLIVVHIADSISIERANNRIIWDKTDAIPRSLEPHIGFIPLWCDLTSMNTNEQLDLGNPDYKREVNAIVARLRGVTPGEMNDIDVITYRRNIRIRNAGIMAITVAFLLAMGLAIFAFMQRNTARRIARESTARELAAYAINNLNEDPELSILLAVRAAGATLRFSEPCLSTVEDVLHKAILSSQVRLTLRGHSNTVTDVTVSADGKRLATASADTTARVWDAANGNLLLVLQGHRKSVHRVVFSVDSKRLATASDDNTVRIWDTVSGDQLLTLAGHGGPLSIAFSPDGKRLATSNDDLTVSVWNLVTGAELLTLHSRSGLMNDLAFSLDGKRIFAATVADGTIQAWDSNTGKQLLKLRGHSGPSRFVNRVAFSPDRTRFATANGEGTAEVWDLRSRRRVLLLRGHLGSLHGVSFSPDGGRLATAGHDRTVRVWDATSGQEILTLRGHSGLVSAVAFSPDGKHLLSASDDQTVKMWDSWRGSEVLTLSGHSERIYGVAFSPDGRRLVTASYDKTAKLWDALNGQQLLTLRGHSGSLDSVSFSPDGSRVATASYDGTAMTWDSRTGQKLLTLDSNSERVYSVAFSPDGGRLATASRDHIVRIWDAATGRKLITLPGRGQARTAVAFSPEGRRLATVDSSNTAIIWDAI